MIYCPYCGSSCVDEAVFCMSCGKKLPVPELSIQPEKLSENLDPEPALMHDDVPAEATTQLKPKQPRYHDNYPAQSAPQIEDINAPVEKDFADDNYDGYYEDVLPKDKVEETKPIDRGMVLQIIKVAGGAAIIIAIAILMMQLL